MSECMIAGVDEAGRGPLAGPVVAAAVILSPACADYALKDSKKLSERQRVSLAQLIYQHALAVSVGHADVDEIDQLNIHHATLLAMRRAVDGLCCRPKAVWFDGLFVPDGISCPHRAVVKGDAKIPAISAASIIAKTTRDHWMMMCHEQYPQYGFAEHKGYPTKKHLLALQSFGVTPIHRKSFAPVKTCLQVHTP